MDPLKLATLSYAVTIILNCTCAALFFNFNPIKKEKHLSVTIRYFMILFLTTACAYLIFLGKIWSNQLISVIISNILFMVGFYSIRYAFLWRTGTKSHLYQNKWILLHIAVFVFIQTYFFHIVVDELKYRIIFGLSSYVLILLSCLPIIPKKSGVITYGEKVAMLGVSISAALLLAVVVIHMFSFDLFIYQSVLMIVQSLTALFFLGAFQTLLLSDISDLHYENSITDKLTGLYNRRYFMEQSSIALKTAQRHEFPLALIMCDIDLFKNINDKYGHNIGDCALQKFSNLLQNIIRDGDILSRYGGEEFAILLPQTDIKGAIILAERMRQETENMLINTPIDELSFTASFGVSSISSPNSFGDSLKAADNALYKAKKSGRNQVQYEQQEV